MVTKGAYEKARHYLETHSKLSEESGQKHQKIIPGPTITISRETGAGAERVGEKLVAFLKNITIIMLIPGLSLTKILSRKY